MDLTALIDQITTRVLEKVAEVENAPSACADEGKPCLLVLTAQHGEHCHQMLESQRLRERYATECALLQEYQCDMERYDAVILYGLTVEALTKIAGGVCDTPFTALAAKALLLGKRIYIPTEEVELYRYASTAPRPYYTMLEEKLKLLAASGVVICAQANLEDAILGAAPAPVPAPVSAPAAPAAASCRENRERRLTKKVITERDLILAGDEKITRVVIGGKAIMTDLARDLAKVRGIEIVRE